MSTPAASATTKPTTTARKRPFAEIVADFKKATSELPAPQRDKIVSLFKDFTELVKVTCQHCASTFMGRARVVTISVGRRNESRAAQSLCPTCVQQCPRCETECAKHDMRDIGAKALVCFDCATGVKMAVKSWVSDDEEEEENEEQELEGDDDDFEDAEDDDGDEPESKKPAKKKQKTTASSSKPAVVTRIKGKHSNGHKKILAMPQFGDSLINDLTQHLVQSKTKKQEARATKAKSATTPSLPNAVVSMTDGDVSEEELPDDPEEAAVRAAEAEEEAAAAEEEEGEGEAESSAAADESPQEQPLESMSD